MFVCVFNLHAQESTKQRLKKYTKNLNMKRIVKALAWCCCLWKQKSENSKKRWCENTRLHHLLQLSTVTVVNVSVYWFVISAHRVWTYFLYFIRAHLLMFRWFYFHKIDASNQCKWHIIAQPVVVNPYINVI